MDDTRKVQLSWLLHVHGDAPTDDRFRTPVYERLNSCRRLLTKFTEEHRKFQQEVQRQITMIQAALQQCFPADTVPTDEEIYRFVELLILEKEGLEKLPFDRDTVGKK